MEQVRLYYDKLDIMPTVLLQQFLRYLGFYVVENAIEGQDCGEVLANIYILNEKYMNGEQNFEIDPYSSATLLILKDNLRCGDEVKSVIYEDNQEEVKFLNNLLDGLYDFVEIKENSFFEDFSYASNLVRSRDRKVAKYIANAFVKNNIMQSPIFGTIFDNEVNLAKMASLNFTNFIADLEKGKELFGENDLLEYSIIYSKYQIDYIAKNTRQIKCLSLSNTIFEQCNELLKKYSQNEELNILKGDIRLELLYKSLWAADDFADSAISHCAYANYKRGKIFRSYLEEYDDSEILLKKSLRQNSEYIRSLYQLGLCCLKNYKYQGKTSIEAFEAILEKLKEKYVKHLLSPSEYNYFYLAAMQIAVFYKTRFNDYDTAYAYNNYAEKIKNENAISEYFRLIWKTILIIKYLVQI